MSIYKLKFLAALLFTSLISLNSQADCTLKLPFQGVVGPGAYDYIERAIDKASSQNCSSILFLINTPGGNLQSTRLIVEKILSSPVPFLCLIYPPGGHAGSAGAIILQACHVSGGVDGTNVGAATPVAMGGEIDEAMKKKIYNDTSSWLDSLTALRGRSQKFGRDIVLEGKALSAEAAAKEGGIDFSVTSIDEFLKKAEGREVRMTENSKVKVSVGELVEFSPDLRFKFLELVTHPQIAYLIFMASLGLLYFELTHPGMVAPGVVGGIGLIISLISFHMLDVQWGGIALIVLGITLMIAEIFVTSFGILGIGGISSFVAGSLLLFNSEVGTLPLMTVLPTALGLGGVMLLMGFMALKAQRRSSQIGANFMIGKNAKVVSSTGLEGKLEIHGELWDFVCNEAVDVGEYVQIQNLDGLILEVTKRKD